MRTRAISLAILLLFAASAAPAFSQDPPTAAETTTPPTDPLPSIEELGIRVRPLTSAELLTEAQGWYQRLQQKARQVADAELAIRGATAEERSALVEEAERLRGERLELSKRLETVVDELEKKGGTVDEFRKYMVAIAGITIDVKDTGAAFDQVKTWLTSPTGGIRWAKNIIFFIVTLFAFAILSRVAGGLTRRTLGVTKLSISDMLRDFFVGTVRKLVFAVGIIVALSMLEVNIGPFLAAIGVVGFIIGFALQETLSNFAAGLMILLYRPYDIGQVVTAGGVTGKVSAMSLVSTTMLTPDNQTVLVPNGSIWGGVITNITGNDTRRVDLVFGIGYDDDIAKAQGILEAIISEHPKTLADPAPVVKLHELADSSVNFVVRPWVKTSDYWEVYWDVTRTVKERFDAEGVSIPFPQQDVHMHQVTS